MYSLSLLFTASVQTCPDETEMLNVLEKYTKVVDLSPDISNEVWILTFSLSDKVYQLNINLFHLVKSKITPKK